jgi:hypothetical protein
MRDLIVNDARLSGKTALPISPVHSPGEWRGGFGHLYPGDVALALFQCDAGVFLNRLIGGLSAPGAEPFLGGGIPNNMFVSHAV